MNTMRIPTALLLAAGSAAPAAAQSDPAGFSTVYNIGVVPPGSIFDIPGALTDFPDGGAVGSDTQLNLFDGGDIDAVRVGDFSGMFPPISVTNSEANIFGGLSGGLVSTTRISVNSGGVVNLFDGTVMGFFNTAGASTINISGGTTRGGNFVNGGGTVNISGGVLGVAGTTLRAITVVGSAAVPSVVNMSGGTIGRRALFLDGTTLNLSGGSIGEDMSFELDASSSVAPTSINITGGSIGNNMTVEGAELTDITISGGSIGDNFTITTDPFSSGPTVLTVSGGFVGDNFVFSGLAGPDATTFNMSGGSFGENFDVQGVRATISGGNFGSGVFAGISSVVIFTGQAFPQFGGGSASGISVFGAGTLATGVLADGSVYIFAAEASDLVSASIDPVPIAPSANPGVLSSGGFMKGLRPGESLTVNGAGELGRNFAVVGATLNIEGGSVGNGLEAAFSEINISGGTIGRGFDAFAGSTVNIWGGTIGDDFDAMAGSTINLFGTVFFVDGVEVTGLTPGESFTITTRDATLSGVLAGGSVFDLDLNSANAPGADFFSTGSTLTVTLVPGACDIVDVALPFGTLDADDIVHSLLRLPSDLAEPNETADFFDVIELLRRVDAGCP